MKEIKNCPSTLSPGFDTYSPTALKRLFNGKKVSHIIDFSYDEEENTADVVDNTTRISVSGVQEKLSAIVNDGKVTPTPQGIQGTYIIKPAPYNKALRDRKQIPANEHLTSY